MALLKHSLLRLLALLQHCILRPSPFGEGLGVRPVVGRVSWKLRVRPVVARPFN